MSDLVLLGFGFAMFFITVYGVLMVSGLKLLKKRLEDEPELGKDLTETDRKGLPTNIKY
jgi:hypothetical protein